MALCNLCPRRCNVDRDNGNVGYCGMSGKITASKAYLHMWEEPCISGTSGSGTVFFTGCTLRCIYCQNNTISRGNGGKELTVCELADVFVKLQEKGAHNINLVTPTHYALGIRDAISVAKKEGLTIPVVYNTGGYELVQTLKAMEGYADIYLPDFKYIDEKPAYKYSDARDYPEVSKLALREMVRQKPRVIFDENGIMKSGVIVRHLLLPGNLKNSKGVIEYVYKTYGDNVYLSIMNQYTPMGVFKDHPELSETPSRREYEKLVDYALSLGVTNAYIQDSSSSEKVYIPDFDLDGI